MRAAGVAALLLIVTAPCAATQAHAPAGPAAGASSQPASPAPAAPASLEGHWEGAFSREGSVQLCALDVAAAPTPSGAAPREDAAPAQPSAATLDIPELGMFAEPLGDCALDGTAVRLHCVYGDFAGVLHAEQGELTALNDRWGPPVRLHLKRASRPADALVRREVSFEAPGVAGRGVAHLAGTLLLPVGATAAARVPGLVAMHGSDTGDRSAWEYRGWGELLARQGIAVLLYDRRGSGASREAHAADGADADGADGDTSFDQLAADALAAHALLARQPEVRADRVGLLGASQSGWTAPLAATLSAKVAFLVLLSPPGVSVFEQELQRVEATARALETDDGSRLSGDDVAAAVAFTQALLDACRAPDRDAAFAALAPQSALARAAAWAPVVQVPESAADLAWFADHDFDPAATLAQLSCPVLAFWGERDTAVPPALNLPPLRAALQRDGREPLSARVWPDCGHDLERGRALVGGDWSWPGSVWLWARKPPGLVDAIADWIRAR